MQQSPAPKDITASSIPDPGFLAATAPILILAATPAQPPTLATSITSSVELVWLPQLFLLPQLEVFSYCYC